MTIPNTITRTLELAHPQEKVWAAISTMEGITSWFGQRADGEMSPGQDVKMHWDTFDASGTLEIKVSDPMSTFAFCWGINGAPAGDPRRTYVEFTLAPTATGTRLTLTESGFAQLPDEWLEQSYQGNGFGWTAELGELVEYLDAA